MNPGDRIKARRGERLKDTLLDLLYLILNAPFTLWRVLKKKPQ
jgi:hypothetical protein